MNRFFWQISIFFVSAQITAAQYVVMDSNAVLPVQLSSLNHNRIGITGDRIKKAFFKSSNISVDVEEGSGQLFIQSVRPNCPSTTLSIISASGAVQELELCFSEGPSEIVLLQSNIGINEQSECIDESSQTICTVALEGDSLAILIDGFLKGIIPEGYTSIEDEDCSPIIHNCLKLQRVGRLVNHQQIIFVYRMQNVSSKKKCVKECQVNVLDGDWVFLDRYKLNPHECGLVLIGCLR